MKSILYFTLSVFIILTGCKNVNKNSLKTSVNQTQNETAIFKTQIENFYQAIQKNDKQSLAKFLSDKLLLITKFGASYNISQVDKNQVEESFLVPGMKILPIKFEPFPKIDQNGQWKQKGIFIQKANENPISQIAEMSPANIDKNNVKKLDKQIKYIVLNTELQIITYWGKQNDKWKILAVELIENGI